ncbi:MAG TPA: hypothetical protein VGE27_01180, partial [Gemmatimonas sp.]|uniref:hypothetical protein n=1 Tax=Gemmatimonas sp. TaxID=1962908 RepID=UPI002ED84B05
TAVDTSQLAPMLVKARRPDDLMVADIWLHNLRVVTGANPTLARRDASRSAVIVLQLPPQSFGEEALLDITTPEIDANDAEDFPDPDGKHSAQTSSQPAPAVGATRMRISGPSRLAFTMPAGVSFIPFTLEAILDACRTWPARKALTAQPSSDGVVVGTPGAASGVANRNADLQFLTGVVKTGEFVEMRRTLTAALDDLQVPAAARAIESAGTALMKVIVSAMDLADDVAAERLVAQRIGASVDAIVQRYPALGRDAGTRALVEAGIGYQAGVGLAEVAEQPEFKLDKRIPFVPTLFAPFRPGNNVTAIEMPYRLVISPVGDTAWRHRTTAVAREGRHELWHTRLDDARTLGNTEGASDVRAIWSEDYGRPDLAELVNTLNPYRMSLDPLDRDLLVRLTAGFTERRDGDLPYTPKPVISRQLILSSLGGLLDASGNWALRPADIDLEQWRHRMSLGRDHYVRVVYAGYLMPFGHAASLIKVTERKFEPANAGTPLQQRVARLRQRFFIVVREPVRSFNGSRHIHDGHAFPFTSVEVLTKVTPTLLAPDDPSCRVNETNSFLYQGGAVTEGLAYREAFWPMVGQGGQNFRFNIAATDRDGRRTTFALPLMFVAGRANTGTAKKVTQSIGTQTAKFIDTIRAGYNAADLVRRQTDIGGDSICYAPPAENKVGDPRLPTDTLRFVAGQVKSASTSQLNAYPEVQGAYVALRPVQRILGRDDAKVHVAYDAIYATEGFGPNNKGEVFLVLTSQNPSWNVSFGPSSSASRTDAVGAVASPSMKITGLSRHIGLTSDLQSVQNNRFNPASFFNGARILGGIKLEDIIAELPTGLSGNNTPRFTAQELPASGSTPARTEARYDWRTTMGKSDALGILIPQADGSVSDFIMNAVTTAFAGAPEKASSVINATMTNFSVNMFGFVILRFNSLRFSTTDGRKPEVTVAMHPNRAVMFGGPLNFINKLREYIPSDGFSDPSGITVTPSGIAAAYALTVPRVQVGAFALSGVSIGAGFQLPFDTEPMTAAFSFGRREDPFSLTVSLLGGGGFLVIGVGTDGVREIEAALEAQARLSIDLGVASGSVEISLGIYFHWLTAASGEGAVELSGYVRLHGEFSVMAIVSMSITFHLQLGIIKRGNDLVVFGEASVTVEVEVLVFSGEVTVRCRREFTSPEADPTFAQLVTGLPTWESYCLAFAAE